MVSNKPTRELIELTLKASHVILAIVLALQLLRTQLPFDFDINAIFSTEQLLFFYAISVITIIALIDAIKSQRKSGFTVPAMMLWFVGISGFIFAMIILFTPNGGYQFNDSTFNTWIGYFLLIGAFVIGLRESTKSEI